MNTYEKTDAKKSRKYHQPTAETRRVFISVARRPECVLNGI